MIPNLDHWILQSVALLLTCLLIPGLHVDGPLSALLSVIALGYINTTIWDAALFCQIPDSLSAHTLVTLLANGAVFWIFVKIMPGISVRGILPALVAPVVFSAVSILLYRYGRDIDWIAVASYLLDIIRGVRNSLAPSPVAP